jgi:hypothetical protein
MVNYTWIDPQPLYAVSPYKTAEGVRFVQVFQSIPELEPYYLEFEKNFDVSKAFLFVSEHKEVPVVAVALYLVFLFVGQRVMKGLTGFNLKNVEAVWNLFLALFSIFGAVRVVPHFFFLFTHKTFQETVCESPDKVRGHLIGG